MPLFEHERLNLPLKTLRDRYLVPPFSILDSQVGEWLKKRNEWESILKNRSENVRNITAKSNTPYINKFDYDPGYKGLERNGNISTFDPFLCEILVRWFSRDTDVILDPFAGGHVRGAVSAILGRDYVGVDLNPMQVEANRENWDKICEIYNSDDFGVAEWFCMDSYDYTHCGINPPKVFDMLLTCPPYYNLEIYSDSEKDLSALKTYDEFRERYGEIIKGSYEMLNDDSFAVIVVEEIRKPDGIFYGFVPDTIRAFTDAGFLFYNEMILENRIMSLGVRCPKYFEQSRKVGRHHQNVLVFFKGNPKNIESKFGRYTKEEV